MPGSDRHYWGNAAIGILLQMERNVGFNEAANRVGKMPAESEV